MLCAMLESADTLQKALSMRKHMARRPRGLEMKVA